jgi:hypothetical protein
MGNLSDEGGGGGGDIASSINAALQGGVAQLVIATVGAKGLWDASLCAPIYTMQNISIVNLSTLSPGGMLPNLGKAFGYGKGGGGH